MKNKYITVLDFEIGEVFQYTIEKGEHWMHHHELDCPYEIFLGSKGHRLSNCEWMAHETPGVKFELE
jgi:hypothetical protein